jgi:hypothetical protein
MNRTSLRHYGESDGHNTEWDDQLVVNEETDSGGNASDDCHCEFNEMKDLRHQTLVFGVLTLPELTVVLVDEVDGLAGVEIEVFEVEEGTVTAGLWVGGVTVFLSSLEASSSSFFF